LAVNDAVLEEVNVVLEAGGTRQRGKKKEKRQKKNGTPKSRSQNRGHQGTRTKYGRI
jgi:hypothetical protein